MSKFSWSFPAIRLFRRNKQIFDFVTFSFLFWLNSSNFGLGWRKRRTLKAKKNRQIAVVVSHLQICPRPLQQFTFRSSVWTFVCQGPFITALQLLNWLAIHQDYYIQVNTILIWLVQKLSVGMVFSLHVSYKKILVKNKFC